MPAINICKEYHSEMNVMVACMRVMQVEKLLRERNIQYDVAERVKNASNGSPKRIRSPVRNTRLRSLSKQVIR